MRSPYSILAVLALAALTLGGCRSVMDPSFMPSGYTYHNDAYKAPPGPPAPGIGYAYNSGINDAALAQWRDVARRMLIQMESHHAIKPQNIFVEMLPDHNAFNASFDYALREELRARGYALANAPAGVLSLRPEAYRPDDVKVPVDANTYNDDPEIIVIPEDRARPDNFTVSLTMLRNGFVTGTVTDVFTLPAYGYVRGEGQNRIDPRFPYAAPPAAAPAKKCATSCQDTPCKDMPCKDTPCKDMCCKEAPCKDKPCMDKPCDMNAKKETPCGGEASTGAPQSLQGSTVEQDAPQGESFFDSITAEPL
jgi:hypothetical protein